MELVNPDSRWNPISNVKGDTTQMAQRAASVTGKPNEEHNMLAKQADTAAWYGTAKEARELTRRAMESVLQKDVKEIAAVIALQRKDPVKAISLLESAKATELGYTGSAIQHVPRARGNLPDGPRW